MLQKIVLVKKFNNYSDKIVKHTPHQFDDFYSYISQYDCKFFDDINFDENDGVDTQIVIKWEYDWTPNYLFACGNESSEYSPISSWFVMEFKKIRGRQYRLTLHRDVMNDFYEDVIDAPAYIEKGSVSPDNPLIFNSEGMLFNQIKQSETLLKDRIGAYYYVAYIDKENKGASGISGDITISVPKPDYVYANMPTTASYLQYLKGTSAESDRCNPFRVLKSGSAIIALEFKNNDFSGRYVQKNILIAVNNDTIAIDYVENVLDIILSSGRVTTNNLATAYSRILSAFKTLIRDDKATFLQKFYSKVNSMWSPGDEPKYIYGDDVRGIESYKNQVVHDTAVYEGITNDRFFKYTDIYENDVGSKTSQVVGNTDLGTYLKSKLSQAVTIAGYSWESAYNSVDIVRIRASQRYFKREDVTNDASVNITIKLQRLHTEDAPYDIIVIPNNIKLNTITRQALGAAPIELGQSMQVAFAEALNRVGTSQGWLYDMQRLPYSELSQSVTPIDNGTIIVDYPSFDANERCYYDTESLTNLTKLFYYVQQSKQVTFDIEHSIPVDEVKISNECDMYRLVSPNGQGIFEFNPAKNGGVNKFNIDCTFRPITPYIHVNIDFNNLYGSDFNDYRGLVCGGDFSIATIKDKWLEYASQNKYFAQTFAREIENMDVSYDIQRDSKIFNAAVGSIGAGVAGGMKGAAAGPWGAVAGAVIGTAGAAGTSAFNIKQGAKAYAEARDFKKDMYNYSLRNIQAQPSTLVKTGSDDYNNKIWVTLEYYSCTDVEKESLREKIKFNGMTLNIISKIKNFIYNNNINYIQAQLIRLDTISEDDHLLMTIRNETARGLYFEREDEE